MVGGDEEGTPHVWCHVLPHPSTAKRLPLIYALLLLVSIAPHPLANYFHLCRLCEARPDPGENTEQLLWSQA